MLYKAILYKVNVHSPWYLHRINLQGFELPLSELNEDNKVNRYFILFSFQLNRLHVWKFAYMGIFKEQYKIGDNSKIKFEKRIQC